MSMHNMMYHFVGLDDKYKGTTLETFKYQLDFLQNNYSASEFTLTFDHGTIDHYDIVFPELEKRNLKGIFFIMTIVPEEGKVPAIDKQRFLEGNYRYDLSRLICNSLGVEYMPNESRSYQEHLTFYSIEERYLRYLRDKILSVQDFEELISSIFYDKFGEESEFAKKHYMSWDNIKELSAKGHIIGSHSHSHIGDYIDYKKSFELLSRNCDIDEKILSYPNGNNKLSDKELFDLKLRKAFIATVGGDSLYNMGRIDDKFFNTVIVNA